jgi:ribosome-associated translation inhibitor RaiA
MRLDIRSRSFPLTTYIHTHVERRIHYALDRVMARIAAVEVRLSDINGPRGGVDKQCGLLVRLADGRTVVVRERDTCVYRVVDRATTRVKRLVSEQLKRRRGRGRGRARDRETIRDRSGSAETEPDATTRAA